MKLFWNGHSCFTLENAQGLRVVTDPYDETVGYRMGPLEVDVLLISHDHHDHNCLAQVKGAPQIIRGAGIHAAQGIPITGVEAWHDDKEGALRGENTIFLMEMDGLRIVHAGDLGQMLTPSQRSALGEIDVLMLPVGGTYTLGGAQAARLTKEMDAKITIPMHYKLPCVTYPITDEQPFLAAMGAEGAPRCDLLDVTRESIAALPRVLVMEARYKAPEMK